MKTLVVTSQVTYIPDNYAAPLYELLKSSRHHLAGVVLLENLSASLLKNLGALWASGCTGLATHLTKNILELPIKKREKACTDAGVPVFSAQSMNDPEMIRWVKENQIDVIVNLRTRCIYRSEILSAPKIGCLNIHHGILPKYRGTFCDLYALAEGRNAGFTIHQMNEKIDAGKILAVREVSCPGEKNYISYLSAASKIEGGELAVLLESIAQHGAITPHPEFGANICEKPIYTKNPSWTKIREFKKGGIQL